MPRFFNKLDLYIAKKFLKTFFITIFLFVVIIIIFDVAEKLDDFLKRDAPIDEIIFDYYVSFIPTLLNTFSPVFIFISVLYFTSRLASRSEIISMLAGGVSLLRIFRPYMVVGALIAWGSYLLNAWVIPIADKSRLKFENSYLRDYWSESKNAIYRQIKPGVVMYMEYFSNHDSSGLGVTLEEYEGVRLKSSIYGRFIRWNREAKKWRLEQVSMREFGKNGAQKIQVLNTLDTLIGFNPKNFFFRLEDVQSLDNNELRRFIESEALRGSPNLKGLQTELYRRYASPFSTFILIAIGIAVAGRKSRGGLGIALGVGIFVILFFLFFMRFFISYGATGVMQPELAVWLPNLLFIPIAWIFYWKAQK